MPPLKPRPFIDDRVRQDGGSSYEAPAVFISYAREDRHWCEQIMRYLEPAEHAGKISIWADTEIEGGEEWQQAILNNLKRASLAVLLITTDFLRSEFVREQEMPLLLDKRQRKELIIIPVTDRPGPS